MNVFPTSIRSLKYLVLVCFIHPALSQTLDELSVTVVFLRSDSLIGTGFFINGKYPYIVTAKHMAVILKPNSTGTVREENDVPYSFSLAEATGSQNRLNWYYHSNADIAALRLDITQELSGHFQKRFIPLAMLEVELKAPQRERPIVVIGFPLSLGTQGHFSPITSESKTASGLLQVKPSPKEPDGTFFLLDKPSIGGFSGAPVFLMPWPYHVSPALTFPDINTKAKCVGLVKGTISDKTGGKLAVIIPSYFVVQFISEVERN